jgi:hypothetical protein
MPPDGKAFARKTRRYNLYQLPMDLPLLLALPFLQHLRVSSCVAIFVAPSITQHSVLSVSGQQERASSQRRKTFNPFLLPSSVKELLWLPKAQRDGVDAAYRNANCTTGAHHEFVIVSHVSLRWLQRHEEARDGIQPQSVILVSVDGEDLGEIRCNDPASKVRKRTNSIQQTLNSHLHFCTMLCQKLFFRQGVERKERESQKILQIRLSLDTSTAAAFAETQPTNDTLIHQLAADLLDGYFSEQGEHSDMRDMQASILKPQQATVALIAGNDPMALCAWLVQRRPKLAATILGRVKVILQYRLGGGHSSYVVRNNFNTAALTNMKLLEVFIACGAPISSIAGLLTSCTHLNVLNLSETHITDADVVLIAKHGRDRMTSVNLQGCSNVTSIDPLAQCRALKALNVAACWMLKSYGKAIGTLLTPPFGQLTHVSFSILQSIMEIEWARVVGCGNSSREDSSNLTSSTITSLELRGVYSWTALLTKVCQCDRQQSIDSSNAPPPPPQLPRWPSKTCPLGLSSMASMLQSLALYNIVSAPPSAKGYQQSCDDLYLFITHFPYIRALSVSRCSSFFGRNPDMMLELVQQLQSLTSVEVSQCGETTPGMTGFLSFNWLKVPGVDAWRGEARKWSKVKLIGTPLPSDDTIIQIETGVLTKNVFEFHVDGL